MTAASNSEARKRNAPVADPVASVTRAIEIVTLELISNGASPGSDMHSWRCAYPDLYGDCDCVAETAGDIVCALRAEGLL